MPEWRQMGKIWINLAHAQTKCLPAQPVTVERYPPLGDTKPVNHSTETTRFTRQKILSNNVVLMNDNYTYYSISKK